jgi:putative flippase GtrA
MFFRIILKKLFGFSLVGGFVTLLSLVLTYLFLGIIKTPLYLTYAGIYIFTIFISYLLNSKFVFKVKACFKKTSLYYLVYISGMVIGLLVLRLYRLTLPYENWVLSYLVLPITMTWNFTMASIALKERKDE